MWYVQIRRVQMIIEKYRHPILFYSLSIIIPWALWFITAYLSHIESGGTIHTILMNGFGVLGLAAPMIVAFILIFRDSDLKKDLLSRFFNFQSIKPLYIIISCGLMLASILLAQCISLLFGYSSDQFSFSKNFSFTAGVFPAWSMLIIAPVLEGLGWHTYGTDTLRRKMNVFHLSSLFAVFWAIWHFPLAFIKDYYQSNLAESGIIYSLNFAISIIPFVILMNWLYYKTGRNITLIIIFHITSGLFNEIFATHPDSKIIQTLLLLILSIIVLIKERELFFKLNSGEQNNISLKSV